jgi:hypothetical protein
MLDLVEEIGDELDDVASAVLREPEKLGFQVIYPHLYAGTMPVTLDLRRRLPPVTQHHAPIDIVDAKSKARFLACWCPRTRTSAGSGRGTSPSA